MTGRDPSGGPTERFEPRLPPDEINVGPTHPLSELATLIAGIAVATLVVVGGGALLVDGVVAHVSPELEARIFGSLFEDETDASDVLHADTARDLLSSLLRHEPGRAQTLRLRVALDDDPNAFALPGGTVVVTSGLLEQVESRNELAFVLAHELGHFEGRHHLRGLGRMVMVHLTLLALVGASGGEALPTTIASLAERGFSRDQEREADAYALALLNLEYGHVGGADHFFRKLPDADAGFARHAAAYLSTHPVTESRIADLAEAARAHGYRVATDLEPL